MTILKGEIWKFFFCYIRTFYPLFTFSRVFKGKPKGLILTSYNKYEVGLFMNDTDLKFEME